MRDDPQWMGGASAIIRWKIEGISLYFHTAADLLLSLSTDPNWDRNAW